MIKRLLSLAVALMLPFLAAAQTLTGSLESNSIYDHGENSPYKGFHSNNYLKLNWHQGRFSAGLQGEWYPSPLPGYDVNLQGVCLPIKYVAWQEETWSVTAGDFYEQIGSGILFRSWEDRNLGLANSIGGVRFKGIIPNLGLSGTVFSGVPRSALSYAPTLVSGADLNTGLIPLVGDVLLTLGGSILHRYEWAPDGDLALLLGEDAPRSVLLHSFRTQLFLSDGITVSAEYVGKSKDFTPVRHIGASDTYELQPGHAFYTEVSWIWDNLSLTASWRYLDNMAFRARRTLGTIVPSNTLNYLPALCQEQTYMLAGLNPYETFAEGESGFRGDLYYRFRRGSLLGGKYGMSFHVGGSWINALGKVLPRRDHDYLAYRDLNLELKRKWSRSFQTTLFVSIQENSPTHGNRNATEAQNVFVLETHYNFSPTTSLRTELQYLYSQEREKDWVAGLVELGIAPSWSFSVSDMYNHGSSREHYWNVSASWSRNQFKCIFGYGRSREGMVCSGGVCRWQPEYKGAIVRLQYAF
ncbi:MAG: hypothetical protein J5745_06065 [Bacteroidales bacterium]|nr:hypothetical protein [Bacteroidales bacterium]